MDTTGVSYKHWASIMQQHPTFLAPGIGFVEDSFSTNQVQGMIWGWFGDDLETLYLLCTSFLLSLHQLHLRSLGIRSEMLGTQL